MSTARFSRIFIAALVALGLLWLAMAAGFLGARVDSAFPRSETLDPRYAARPGINLAPADLAPDHLDTTLATLERAGIVWVRFALPWDDIEPARGQFRWEQWDAVAATFARYEGLEPVVVLDRSPAWARGEADAENPFAPPHERAHFGAYARSVAQRYGDQLTYYQIWDEPNIAPHWGARPADPADYLGLLREAAVVLRETDPDARIVAAALAPTTERGGANLSDLTFLDQLYSLSGRAWFDYPAVQPYGFSAGPDDPPDPRVLNFGRAWEARQVMLRHGDAGTPLWATSFGWNAGIGAGETSAWGNVDTAAQASYAAGVFEKAATDWPWLGPVLWTEKFPAQPATLDALALAVTPSPVLPPGSHRPDHPAIRYGSGWRITRAAADPSADGDKIDFAFNGTGVALEVQGGPYWAYLTVLVDGLPANRLPRDEAGNAYLVLHDPASRQRLIPLAFGLSYGRHTVGVKATGGWGQWPLQGIVVSSAPSRSDWTTRALIALVPVATLLFVFWYGRRSRRPAPANLVGGDATTVTPRAAQPAPMAALVAALDRVARVPSLWSWSVAVVLILLFLLSRSGVVDLLALALVGLLFLIRPDLAPPLIAASLPFWQRTEPVLRWQFGLFELLAWLGLVAWIARWLLDRLAGIPNEMAVTPSGRAIIDISVVFLFAAGLLATVFASEQGVAWREFRIVFLFGAVFYWLITRAPFRDLLRDQSHDIRSFAGPLVAGLLAGATIASLIGLWQLLTGQGRVDVEGVGRIAALYGSPNNLALLLGRAVPLAMALTLFDTFRAGEQAVRPRMYLRIAAAAVLLVALAAAVATFSKGALLLGLPAGISVVLLGGAWRTGRRRYLWLWLGLIIMAAIVLAFLFRTPRFADLFNFGTGTTFLRLKLWRGALNMALDHPLLGVGPDNFLYAYRTRYVLPSGWQELNLSHPHNILLDLWTRLGLVGVVAGFAALGVAFRAGWRLFRKAGPGVWPVALGLLGGLAATLTHGLIDNSLFLPDLMGWFVAALGIFWLYDVTGEM